MAVREVLRYPDRRLKQVCEAIAGDERARAVATDLLDTMRSFPGCVGIAAPQIGELVRIVVVDVSAHPKGAGGHGELVLVDPLVVAEDGADVSREGCLSIPDLTADVRRATTIALTATTPAGARVEIESGGFEARCLLHELDHLDGILFLDRVASLRENVFRRKRYR